MVAKAADEIEVGPTSLTIKQWCAAEQINPATFWKYMRDGIGPRTFSPPGTRLVRIVESRQSYHNRMAALAESRAGKLARKRRVELNAQKARLSAESERHVSKTQATAEGKARRQAKGGRQ
jgi:hypothetical protein